MRKERQWVSRGILNDSEQQTFFTNLGSFAQAMEPTRLKLATESPKRLQEIDAFLAKPPFVAVNQALANKRGQRPYEPAWHEPLGHKSVRGIARALGRLHEYEVFYAASSEVMHVSKYTDHIKIGMGKVKLEPIRHLEEFAGNLRYTVATAISTYRKLLTYYRPGQLVEFSSRYVALKTSKAQVERLWPNEAYDSSLEWTDFRMTLVDLCREAKNYGWDFAGSELQVIDFRDGLRQAGVDGAIRLWGRKQHQFDELSRQEPLQEIARSYFNIQWSLNAADAPRRA